MSIPMPDVSPPRVVAAAIVLFVAYWIAAMFVPAIVLRDLFNSLAFGAQALVVVTWATAAFKSIRNSESDGAWLLILAVFYISFVAMVQRMYVITFNMMGRPEAWSESAISGFWPYSYMIAGVLFLMSPGVKSDGVRPKAWFTLVGAGAVGGFLAGVMFALQIPTF